MANISYRGLTMKQVITMIALITIVGCVSLPENLKKKIESKFFDSCDFAQLKTTDWNFWERCN